MQQDDLVEGDFYAFRTNTRAWVRDVDPPQRTELVMKHGRGQVTVRFDDGTELNTKAIRLVCPWDDDAVARILETEMRERAFLRHTNRNQYVGAAIETVFSAALNIEDAATQQDRVEFDPYSLIEALERVGVEDAVEYLRTTDGLLGRMEWWDDEMHPSIEVALPVAESIAAKLAPTVVAALDLATRDELEDLRSRYPAIVESTRYLPAWNLARSWAGLQRLGEDGSTPDDVDTAILRRAAEVIRRRDPDLADAVAKLID